MYAALLFPARVGVVSLTDCPLSLPGPSCLPSCLPAEDGEFVPLASKNNFNLGTLGMLLGMLQEGLTDLQIIHCNDLFASGSPLGTIAMLR